MTKNKTKKEKKTKVLITGASGFVGNKILAALKQKEVEITAVIRSTTSLSNKFLESLDEVVYSEDIFLEDEDWWINTCRGNDVVIHAAWYAEPGKYLQSIKNIDCLRGSLNLAKGAAEAGVQRFIGLGTCFEYEMCDKPLTIESNHDPQTLYASSKLSLYFLLKTFFELKNVEFVWCRLFYLFGDGEDSRRFIPYLRNKLENDEIAELTSGLQVRDFLDVNVAGKMIAKIATGTQEGLVNVCSGEPITVKQLAENIADEYGKRELLKFGVREDNLVDPAFVVGVPNIE